MPLELNVWRIDGTPRPVGVAPMDLQHRLEDLLAADVSVASPDWMLIGRQVPTDHGGFIDLLALDADGRLVVLELKRDRTPRDVVAQVLDYGSRVRTVDPGEIPRLYEAYRKKYLPDSDESLDAAFRRRFGVRDMPAGGRSGSGTGRPTARSPRPSAGTTRSSTATCGPAGATGTPARCGASNRTNGSG